MKTDLSRFLVEKRDADGKMKRNGGHRGHGVGSVLEKTQTPTF